jgi:hypothetical protein
MRIAGPGAAIVLQRLKRTAAILLQLQRTPTQNS